MYLHILIIAGWVVQLGHFEENDKHGRNVLPCVCGVCVCVCACVCFTHILLLICSWSEATLVMLLCHTQLTENVSLFSQLESCRVQRSLGTNS